MFIVPSEICTVARDYDVLSWPLQLVKQNTQEDMFLFSSMILMTFTLLIKMSMKVENLIRTSGHHFLLLFRFILDDRHGGGRYRLRTGRGVAKDLAEVGYHWGRSRPFVVPAATSCTGWEQDPFVLKE